jgi:hypothetical protein
LPDTTKSPAAPGEPLPKGCTVGRSVHYILPRIYGEATGQHRAAIIAAVDTDANLVCLVWMTANTETDCFNVGEPVRAAHLVTDVPHDPGCELLGTWHYIEQV